ncbi:MAG: hypothetical protein VX899_09345 [Myxococcota bacterium]|nr:hypothetical protein [Myxococcota bacterium]
MTLLLLLGLGDARAQTSSSIVFEFNPQFTSVHQNDAELEAYGFAPVGGRFTPQYGVRGVYGMASGLRMGLVASAGFSSNQAQDNPVPTTTNWTQIGGIAGYRLHERVAADLELGFGSLTHTVGSERSGGALLYLGPYAQPQVNLILSEAPWAFALGVGWMLHVPVSAPHSQPLWEEEFKRGVVQGPVLSLQSGFGRVGQ